MSGRRTANLIAIVQDRTVTPARTVARVTCAKCGSHGDVTVAGSFNPEWTVKRFVSVGWGVTGHQDTATCPACIAERRSRRAGESPKLIEFNPNKWEASTVAEEKARALTISEKANVRRLLDKHFDDATGQYLDGFSDQKVGVEANVPWACVTEMREAAYGPLRVDPAVQAIATEARAGINRLEAKAAALQEVADKLRNDVRALGAELSEWTAAIDLRLSALLKAKK